MLKDEAYTKGNTKTLSELFADDYIAINAHGGTATKQDLMKLNMNVGTVVYESHVSDEIHVRPFGNIALVTGRYSFKYKKPVKGDDSGQYRYTSIYVKRAGRWQIVADQFTRIKK